MSEDEFNPEPVLRWIRQFVHELLEALYDRRSRPRLRITPLDQEGTPVTTIPSPFPLQDNESLPLGLALTGTNPNGLTIASATWTASGTVGVTPAADGLTATATTTKGAEGDGTVDATATLSDGSTLTASFAVVVAAAPVPLALEIVPGTPTAA